MRVRLLTNVPLPRLREVGGDDPSFPRLPLAYPFYRGLEERGWEVEPLFVRPGFLSILRARRLRGADAVLSVGTSGPELANLALSESGHRRTAALVIVDGTDHARGWKPRARHVLLRRALRAVDPVIFMTKEQADESARRLGVDPRRVERWRAGVDTRYFVPRDSGGEGGIREELRGATRGEYVVVSGGYGRDELRTARLLEGTGVRLVRMTQDPEVESFWKRLAPVFSGRLDAFCVRGLTFAEVRHTYQHARCLVNLSRPLRSNYGWTAATEAMACGIPVILTREMAARELERWSSPDAPSPLVTVETAASEGEVRDVLCGLLADRARCAALGRRGREFVERHFTIEASADELSRILRSRWEGG